MTQQWACVLGLDNIVLNNYWRKFYTYQQIGWDDNSIHAYLGQKKNIMQIASFNTPTVNFSASSRRNRFYEIYDNPEMLGQDVAWENSIEALKKINLQYRIFIICDRNIELKEKTLETMTRLGFPMENITFFFKQNTEKLFNYRKNCVVKIHETYPTGVLLSLNQNDAMLAKRYSYTPVGFTSIKDPEEFEGKLQIFCHDWNQICSSLNCA